MSAPFAAVMHRQSALLPNPHWCKLAADFYPTVKAALRHESADSKEDREGLGSHLGQGHQVHSFNSIMHQNNKRQPIYTQQPNEFTHLTRRWHCSTSEKIALFCCFRYILNYVFKMSLTSYYQHCSIHSNFAIIV